MISLTSWHNWVAFAAMLLIVGILLHKLGGKVPGLGGLVAQAFGA